jgi:hypothetical protein
MSDTVGVLWRAGTGTVDPWTKNNIVTDNAAGLQKGAAGQISGCQAYASACTDATKYLVSRGADPSQAGCGLKKSLCLGTANIEKMILFIAIAGVILLLLMHSLKA